MFDVTPILEKRQTTKRVFKGELLQVFRDSVQLPDNTQSIREWINHPGACAVVPVFDNGDIMLLRQFRYAPQQVFYEVPAGKIDAGEDQDTTAQREMEEETGLRCKGMAYIGHFYPGIGYSDEIIHIYTAWGLEDFENKTDHDEFLQPFRVPFQQAVEWVHEGVINDAKTAICLLRAERWWNVNRLTYR